MRFKPHPYFFIMENNVIKQILINQLMMMNAMKCISQHYIASTPEDVDINVENARIVLKDIERMMNSTANLLDKI